jgi:hypothetical protein
MRSLLLFLGMIVFGLSHANAAEAITYKASITNLTQGQVMTHPVLVIHDSEFLLFTLGEEASEGLKQLAKDGLTEPLVIELDSVDEVVSVSVGSNGVMPGETLEIMFSGSPHAQLSLASMLAVTNDAFVSLRGFALNFPANQKQTVLLKVYDAGAEINNEDCAFIPGCGGPLTNTMDDEGFVHPHPGLHLQGDLDPLSAFANVAAKIILERVK